MVRWLWCKNSMIFRSALPAFRPVGCLKMRRLLPSHFFEEFYHVRIPPLFCFHQRRFSIVIPDICVGPVFNEELGYFDISRVHQRRTSIVRRCIHVDSDLYEQFRYLWGSALHQRRLSVVAPGARVGSALQEQFRYFSIFGFHQRRNSVFVFGVHVGSVFQKQFRYFSIFGFHQRRNPFPVPGVRVGSIFQKHFYRIHVILMVIYRIQQFQIFVNLESQLVFFQERIVFFR